MTARALSAYHSTLRNLLAPLDDADARQTGFCQRQSKLSASVFVLTLVCAVWRSTPRSLAAYVRHAEHLDPALTLSPQSFDARFTDAAVALLKRALAAALAVRLRPDGAVPACLAPFKALYILDSTTVALPEALRAFYRGSGGAASSAAAKCFWLLEYLSATTQQVLVRDGVKADQDMGAAVLGQTARGALWLMDLGFWSAASLAAIAAHGSFFLSRLHAGAGVYTGAGTKTRLDLMAWLRALGEGQVGERAVFVGSKQRVACRLVAARVPAWVAAERRRKAKEGARRRRRTLRAQTLERMDWSVWVTNASEARLPASHVAQVYRVRWQVELVFKLAKSAAGLTTFTSAKRARVECELLAGLIAVVIAGHLGALAQAPGTRLSAVKVWQALSEKAADWARALLRRKGARHTRALVAWIARHAKPTTRKSEPSTYDMLWSLEPAPPCDGAPPAP